MKKIILILTTLLAFSSTSFASSYPFGSGGETGNYYSMTNDIFSDEWCGTGYLQGTKTIYGENVSTGGSIANLDGIITKKLFGGIVQIDALKYYAKINPSKVNENSINIVANLHKESVHLLIPKQWKPQTEKKSSWWGWGDGDDQTVQVSVDLLKNQTIGSWGGSLVSTKALGSFLDLNLNIVEVDPSNLRSDIPLLIVGGQPYQIVQDLLDGGNFNLVSINYMELAAKVPFYTQNMLSYNVGGKLLTVPSVGINAVLVAKKFRNKSKNSFAEQLSKCIDENVYDFADDFSTNPNWASVAESKDSNQSVNWKYFDID